MSLGLVAGCTAFGAAAGALLPRAAYRLSVPAGTPPRSACGQCARRFPVGLAGWVYPGAACRCGHRPGPAPAAAIAVCAVSTGLLAGALAGPQLAAYLLAAVLGVLLAAVDLRCLRLPDPLVAAMALLSVLPLIGLAAVAGEPGRCMRAGLAAALSFAVYLLLAVLPGGGLGFGDVKLAAVLGFLLGWVGWPAVGLGLVLPHLINGPVALFLLVTGRARRGTALPFGPALLAGALLAVALQG